jgi:hypothetical protein
MSGIIVFRVMFLRGMKTAYIHRSTEDPEEDMAQIASENRLFIEGIDGSESCGLVELARIIGV